MPTDVEQDLARLGRLFGQLSPPITIDELRRGDGTFGSMGDVPVAGVDAAVGSGAAAEIERAEEVSSGEPVRAASRRRASVLAAVALVAAALAVLVLPAGRRPSAPLGSSQPSGSSTLAAEPSAPPGAAGGSSAAPPTTAAVASTTAASVVAPTAPTSAPDPARRLDSYGGWLWPSSLPTGYELRSVRASAPVATSAGTPTTTRWERRDGSGQLVSSFSLVESPLVLPDPTDQRPPPRPNATVHGQPANAFDGGEGNVVSWVEDGVSMLARGISISLDETRRLAEQTVHDPTAARWTLSASSGYVERARQVVNDVVTISASWGTLRSPSAFISVSTAPDDGESIDALHQRLAAQGGGTDYTVERVGALDRLVGRQAPDEFGPYTEIVWNEGGASVFMTGRAPAADMLGFAAAMTTVDPNRIVTDGRAITEQAGALAVLDLATFADGTTVSTRTVGNGPIALCVDAPATECRWQESETSLVGGRQEQMLDTFLAGGTEVLVGWHEGSVDPVLAPSFMVPPAGSTTATTATISDVVHTAAGTFFHVLVPAGELPPSVTFSAGSSAMVGSRFGVLFGF